MKNILKIIILLVFFTLISCGKGDKTTKGQIEDNQNNLNQVSGSEKAETVEFKCEGMTCSGCEDKITEEVKKLDGIKEVTADSKSKFVKVSYAGNLTNKEAIQKAINAAGYDTQESKSANPHECDKSKCPGKQKK